MDNTNTQYPASQNQTTAVTPPEPEVLKPRTDDEIPTATPPAAPQAPATPEANKHSHHRTYRPSHKATFIGLAAVVLILAVNASILAFVLKGKVKTGQLADGQVSISAAALKKIGVNSSTIGDSGVQLVVDPDAQFNGKMKVAGDVSIGGQLKINSKFIASDADLTQLEAGNTALSQLNVNGNSTLSNLTLRTDLGVAGKTQLQGPVTIGQLLTVNNSVNIAGNLAIGGTLSTSTFRANSLTSTSTLTIGGHVITGGPAPSVGPGSALGSNGTISISGNDSAGVININIGVGASGGTLASVAFHNQFGATPRVVISPIGVPGSFYVLNLSANGFSVGVGSGLPPGGYAIDYIVEQ